MMHSHMNVKLPQMVPPSGRNS